MGRAVKDQGGEAASSVSVSVWLRKGERQPEGLIVQGGRLAPGERRLIPWAVLPGRARSQMLDLLKYVGVVEEPFRRDEEQLPLSSITSGNDHSGEGDHSQDLRDSG